MAKMFEKFTNEAECRVLEVLGPLAGKYNSAFTRLELPIAISIDVSSGRVVLPHYDGEDLIALWNEADGGSRMNDKLSVEAAEIIADLSSVDLTEVRARFTSDGLSDVEFDHATWFSSVPIRLGELVRQQVLHRSELPSILQIASTPWTSPKILTNGDFYPRNCIPRPTGKVVVIDWDPRIGSNRIFIVDHIESVIAFMFVHMWGNRKWQVRFMKEAAARFTIDPLNLQRSLLFRSFEQAYYWRGERPQLLFPQVAILRDSLSVEHVARWLS